MEETGIRKLPVFLEVLIVAVIVYVFSLITGFLITPFIVQLIQSAVWSVTLITFLRSILGLFLGGLICFKLIENRSVHWGILLLMSAVYQLIKWIPAVFLNSYIASFGQEALVRYSRITSFAFPLLSALLMVLLVRLVSAHKKETVTVSRNGPEL